jgi:hypothetical protein
MFMVRKPENKVHACPPPFDPRDFILPKFQAPRVCSDAQAYLLRAAATGVRPYFLLCQIGDQQSEQEDRGQKSDLE